jgi:CheY-like chemotaxis protein
MNEIIPLVLAAEDEETDAFILRLAFQKAKINNPLIVVRDGAEAVNYLSGSAPYANRATHPLPSLVLLDLKMPRMSGFDVLAWLATRPDLKDLPAIVLSSSSDDSDILKARQMGARDYFVKPNDLSRFVKIIQTLSTRWLAPIQT